MSFGTCSCPDCGTTLRIRDRTFVGRQVHCPECRVQLVIEQSGEDGIAARKTAPNKPTTERRVGSEFSKPDASSSIKRQRQSNWMQSPLFVSWALAIATTSLVLVSMLRPAVRFQSSSKPSNVSAIDTSSDLPATKSEMPESGSEGSELASLQSRDEPVSALEPVNLAEKVAATDSTVPLPPDSQLKIEPEPTKVEPLPQAPLPAAEPKIDIDAALKQKLVAFDQSKPASRRDLLELMEELLGVPVEYDIEELGETHLDKQMTLKLENTTAGDVLKSILNSAGWEFIAESNLVRVRPKIRN